MTPFGDDGCEWTDFLNSSAGTGNPQWIDHNANNGSGYLGYTISNHGGLPNPTNAVVMSMRANIYWAPSSSPSNKAVGDREGTVPMVNTLVNSSTIVDWNLNYNGSNSTLFGVGGASTNCNPSTFNGTPYELCATVGGPGAHQTTVNPKYIDTTRRMDTWASRVMGQADSPTGVFQAMWQCASIRACIDGAWAWVRQGWQPTNVALKGTAHDGKIIGFTGTLGSGYSGTCGVTITPQDAWDLGGTIPAQAATATCTFAGGVPQITLTNGGAHYRIATPAAVAITCGGCTPTVAASLTPIIQPSDIGPVPMVVLPTAF
jgi:hypothetical protein